MNHTYESVEPLRAEINALTGNVLLEFGSPTCGHCIAAQPLIADAMAQHGSVRHIKIADGAGRTLGRSFKVKLWPTLIFLERGAEKLRIVRPTNAAVIAQALAAMNATK